MYVSVDGDMTRKKQAILVVDSCADSRGYTVQELSLAGYAVVEACSPVQCMDFVDREFPALIIVDPYMPGADGFALLTEIRERYSAAIMPIIVSSADANSNTIVRSLTMGANDYIMKPADRNVFLARVYTQIHLGQARRQITEQQERLNHVLAVQRVLGNMTSEGLVVTDDEDRIIYRNDVVSGLCSGKAPAVVGELFSLMFPKEVVGALELLRQHHGDEGIFEQEFHWGSPYDKHMIVRSCPVVVGDGERLRMWGLNDVTEVRHLEYKVRAEEQLGSISRFVQGLNGQMDSLFSNIEEASQVLKRAHNNEGLTQNCLHTIEESVACGRKLAEKTMKACSGGKTSRPDKEDIGRVLAVVVQAAHLQLGDRITFILHVTENLPMVPMSLRTISGIVGNILGNAIDAISGTGEIHIAVSAESTRGAVRIVIEDSGGGIDQRTLEHIGEPFYSTKTDEHHDHDPEQAGKGLGIWSARSLVHSHGGVFWIESEPGHGTKVIVDLPCCRQETQQMHH